MSLNVLSVPTLIVCWSCNPSSKGMFNCKNIYENNRASSATTLRSCFLACKYSKCWDARRTIRTAVLPMILWWSRNPWSRGIFGCKTIYENKRFQCYDATTLFPCLQKLKLFGCKTKHQNSCVAHAIVLQLFICAYNNVQCQTHSDSSGCVLTSTESLQVVKHLVIQRLNASQRLKIASQVFG